MRSYLVGGIILVLLVVATFSVFQYSMIRAELEKAQSALQERVTNQKIAEFAKLFVEKVLKAEGEVSFEDRLRLENAVRELKDSEVFQAWNRFVESATEDEAQKQVKLLLELLVNKIRM